MTVVERFDAQLAAAETHATTRVVAATALSLFLLAPHHSANKTLKTLRHPTHSVDASSDTAQISREVLPDRRALLAALLTMHDELLREQIDLTQDERAIIYGNLWDLYE